MADDAVVAAIVATVTDVDEGQVRAVLTALEAIRDGAPVGTLVRDVKTGAVALRVSDGGMPVWKVTAPDGAVWTDLQPRLAGWESLGSPADAAPAKQANKKEG
jgi:hypothetical protein